MVNKQNIHNPHIHYSVYEGLFFVNQKYFTVKNVLNTMWKSMLILWKTLKFNSLLLLKTMWKLLKCKAFNLHLT